MEHSVGHKKSLLEWVKTFIELLKESRLFIVFFLTLLGYTGYDIYRDHIKPILEEVNIAEPEKEVILSSSPEVLKEKVIVKEIVIDKSALDDLKRRIKNLEAEHN